MSHVLPGRSGRRDPASSVAPVASGYEHSMRPWLAPPSAPWQRVFIPKHVLGNLAAEEEGDAPPDVHRMLVPLHRRERLSLQLACIRGQLLAEPALAVRLDLGRRRRLEVLAERLHLLSRDREVDGALGDRRDLLGRDVARLAERARRDREAVEDVPGVVARDLVDLADLAPVGGVDLPAGTDQEPGDGIGHAANPDRETPGGLEP